MKEKANSGKSARANQTATVTIQKATDTIHLLQADCKT